MSLFICLWRLWLVVVVLLLLLLTVAFAVLPCFAVTVFFYFFFFFLYYLMWISSRGNTLIFQPSVYRLQQSSTQIECWWFNVLEFKQENKQLTLFWFNLCNQTKPIKRETDRAQETERERAKHTRTQWVMRFCSHISNEIHYEASTSFQCIYSESFCWLRTFLPRFRLSGKRDRESERHTHTRTHTDRNKLKINSRKLNGLLKITQ